MKGGMFPKSVFNSVQVATKLLPKPISSEVKTSCLTPGGIVAAEAVTNGDLK